MQKNEGNLDRILRIIAGLVLLSLTIMGPQSMWGLAGLIPLLTGLAGYCPIYSILGINSCPLRK